MKTIITTFILLMSISLSAQDLLSASTVTLTIDGSSNIHDWTSTAQEVFVTGQFQSAGGTLTAVDQLNVRIPVKKIKSTKGSIMDNKTYDALRASKFPNITFKATNVEMNGDQIKATGTLTIAGKYRTVTILAKGKAVSGGYEISGTYDMKMSQFGIERPTALMGTVSTTDDVKINFAVRLKG
jgi:polyisoprenoid-binding protein YceI